MFRQTEDAIRLFLNLFLEAPPFPWRSLAPGVCAVVAFVVLALWFGPDQEAAAFVTAFTAGLALRLGLRARGTLRRLMASFSRREVMLLLPVLASPLLLIIWIDQPLWCQRLQSLYHVTLGGMFLSDVMGRRSEMAALFWPSDDMTPFLPALTRMMVLFNAGFLLLNETLIQVLLPGGWLVFWAVLPVLAHMVLSALILTVIRIVEQDAARG